MISLFLGLSAVNLLMLGLTGFLIGLIGIRIEIA